MKNHPHEKIAISTFCAHHHISVSFVETLHDNGILMCTKQDDEYYIEEQDLNTLQKAQNLHTNLEVNMEGLEVIFHLLQQVEQQQETMRILKNRLAFYGE